MGFLVRFECDICHKTCTVESSVHHTKICDDCIQVTGKPTPGLDLKTRKPAKKVSLFDGTKCRFCILICQGVKGTFAVLDYSYHAGEEIDAAGVDELLPDGAYESEEKDHQFAIVTFRYDCHRDFDGYDECDVIVERYIPVTVSEAFAHVDGNIKLWSETLDGEE